MVFLKMTGRCGNQMFQYAFARKVMEENKCNELCIDISIIRNSAKKTKDKWWVNALTLFKTHRFVERDIDFAKDLSIRQRMLLREKIFLDEKLRPKLKDKYDSINKRFNEKLNKNGIYYGGGVIHNIEATKGNVYVQGYFEDRSYFDDIRDILCDELYPKKDIEPKNKDFFDLICNNNSVCVSFRKWLGEVTGKEFTKREVCTQQYYVDAIEKMKTMVPDAVFIVFSDDVEWVKQNFDFSMIENAVYFEDGTDSLDEKLRLMFSCKHFIMSNSTFCWWAQYLCKNNDKVVISPKRWFSGEREDHLLQDDWIKV